MQLFTAASLSFIGMANHKAVVLNIFGRAESQGCIPVAQGAPVHLSAHEKYNILSRVAFV